MARPPKLDADKRRMVRLWWRIRREIPSRKQMAAFFGVSESTLIKAAQNDYKVGRA